MAVQNYTPLDELMAKIQKSFTSLPTKEIEPAGMREEQKDIRIAVEHKELDEEVKPHIQVHEEVVEVPPDLQQMGVQATPTAQVQTHQPFQSLLSDEEIIKGLHQPTTSSFRWLAELALYILKHAHIVLKTVHGKVVRVIND